MVRSTLVYIFVALYLLIMSPIGLFCAWVVRDTAILYRLACFCFRSAGWMAGIRVEVQGRERVLSGETYVFLSNHQSNCDAPVLAHTIPRNFRALVKKEVMRLPVLSTILRRVEFVPIDRQDPQKARAGIDRGAAMLRQGYSFVAFPEGTRSRDARLGTFKKGVFIMALKAKKPIVPISIVNSRAIQPPGAYKFRPGSLRVVFHAPIPTDGMTIEDRDRLIEMTREAIAAGLQDE